MIEHMPYDEDCALHFAMRYALGRNTTAPSIVCGAIKRNWGRLLPGTGKQMKKEIREAVTGGRAGNPDSVEQWNEILELPDTEEK